MSFGVVDPGRQCHDDFIKWKQFPCYWPFVWGIHQLSVTSPQKGQWLGDFMSPLICAWTNRWINNRDADDLRRTHYVVTVMFQVMATHRRRIFIQEMVWNVCKMVDIILLQRGRHCHWSFCKEQNPKSSLTINRYIYLLKFISYYLCIQIHFRP